MVQAFSYEKNGGLNMVWMTDFIRLSIVICKNMRYYNMYNTVATHASNDIKQTILCTLKKLGLNLIESKMFFPKLDWSEGLHFDLALNKDQCLGNLHWFF